MKNKLLFLTKMSLNKMIKTKWFIIANVIFAILIIGLINIDMIIKFFGGDFNADRELLIIDEASVYTKFEENYEIYKNYATGYDEVILTKYDGSYDEALDLVKEEDKMLLVISLDDENYLKAKLVSNETVGTITNTLINMTLTSVRSEIVMDEYNITLEMYQNVNKSVSVETVILSDDENEDGMIIASFMQVFTLPIFMLIIFLVQMIGAEVNEEKTTKSMEIIISNVSPKIHFLSKIIASNTFVIIQGVLLIVFLVIGLVIRFIIGGGSLSFEMGSEFTDLFQEITNTNVIDSLVMMVPIMIVILLLTFLAYSLLAGVLASMTTNLEDFQQLQTPIMIFLLVGYYLSIMAGMFDGSIFIKIMSYIPFISSLLAPTLYVMGEITLIDLFISIILLIVVIMLLIKYGLRIYKVGILNYSQSGLWKKMFKAIKERDV